jgi:hypothetical protein
MPKMSKDLDFIRTPPKRMPLIDKEALTKVKKDKVVKGAFVELLHHYSKEQPLLWRIISPKLTNKYYPSHGIYHANSVARKAIEVAERHGVKDQEEKQDLVIAAYFHDAIRHPLIEGKEFAVKSAELAFSKLSGILPRDRRERIKKIITGKHELSKFLDYGDFLDLRSIWRAMLMGRGESEELKDIKHEDAVKFMEMKYNEKLGSIPPDLREEARGEYPISDLRRLMRLDKKKLEDGDIHLVLAKFMGEERTSSAKVLKSFLDLHPELETDEPKIFGGMESVRDLEKRLLAMGHY